MYSQEEPSCLGSQQGVGNNLCLLAAWWQLPPLGSGPHQWYFVCCLRQFPKFQQWLCLVSHSKIVKSFNSTFWGSDHFWKWPVECKELERPSNNDLLPFCDAQSFLWSPSAVAVAFSWYTHSSQTLSSSWVPTPTSEPRHPEHEHKDLVLPFCYLFILVCLIVLLFLSSPVIFLCGLMTQLYCVL